MKHCILIYYDGSEASKKAVIEIQAGIEEEALHFEARIVPSQESDILARLAAEESSFGCGIGVYKGRADLWLVNHNMSILSSDEQSLMRRLGLNAGRSLKKLPFV